MVFHVKHPSYYDSVFPNFRKPSEIGFFSMDCERNFHDDNHQLKYITIPPNFTHVNMDLKLGFAEGIRKEFGKKERIDAILLWTKQHKDTVKKHFTTNPETGNINIDFVCFRGLLTVICSTIYENKEDWVICATKFKSVIYLCAFDTNDHIHRRENATERDKFMSSWGYKFEQYMTADSPNGKPDTSSPVNEKEEYCIVAKGRLKEYNILFSAEVDGIDPQCWKESSVDPTSTNKYIELKTSRIITHDKQHTSFCRYKLLKWWLQSFLIGITKIICGFRNDNGIVKNLETFNVADIPNRAKTFWSGAACLNFCSDFFAYVKTCVVKDDPNIVYQFYWRPGSPVTCKELATPGEYQVLPSWYL